jgi:DNA-binding response OmpR family regulator
VCGPSDVPSRKRVGLVRSAKRMRAARGKRAMLDAQTTMEILVAADDPSVCDALTYLLTPGGFRVTSFGDGGSLLAAARTRVPACIILDVQLPDRSGLDVLRDLNAPDYPAPIIVISGHGTIPMAVDAIKQGALDLIEKPFAPETMLARVREAVNGWRRRIEAGSDLPPAFPRRPPIRCSVDIMGWMIGCFFIQYFRSRRCLKNIVGL